MQVNILQENLVKLITRAGRIISQKNPLPILQNVLLKTSTGKLTIFATNLELSEKNSVNAKVDQAGDVCIPARTLLDLVTSLPPEVVSLTTQSSGLLFRCGGVKATIPVSPVAEYPVVNVTNDKNLIVLGRNILVEALSSVLFSVASDDARPLLAGLKIKANNKELVFAGTDGYRLSIKRIIQETSADIDMVVPARALGEVLKLLQEERGLDEVGLIKADDGQLVFRVGETEVITRVIDGQYPDFERIIPRTHTTAIKLNTADFLHLTKSIAIFARDSANIIRLLIDKDRVTISANAPEVGEGQAELAGETSGDGGEMALNCRFLLEFLGNCKAEEFLFEMTGALNPGVFRLVGDPSYLHVIMPVRTRG